MKVSIATVAAAILKLDVAYAARLAKAEADNFGRAPTVGKDGRLHAPCDNYMWINGEVYLGGQYLPEDEDTKIATTSYKFKVETAVVPDLLKIIPGSIGKTWVQDGVAVAYFYAAVSAAEKRVLEKLLPQASKRIVLASENTKSKTWIFKTTKYIRQCTSTFGHAWQDRFVELEHIMAPGVQFDMYQNKKGNLTFRSEFDNQLVCYEYSDSVLTA